MLNLPLNHLAPISLLRSDRWLFSLLSGDHQTAQTLQQTANSALLDYQHYTNRKEDNQTALKMVFNQSDAKYFDFIQTLGDKFLQWQGNRFEVKREYLSQWQEVCAFIDPLIILGYLYAYKLHIGELTSAQLAKLNQCPQALIGDSNKEYADNHVHLGGHGSSRKAILDFALEPCYLDDKQQWPTIAEFNFLATDQFKRNDLPLLLNALFYYLFKASSGADENKLKLPQINQAITCRQRDSSLATQIKHLAQTGTFHQALAHSTAPTTNTDTALLMLYTSLFYAQRFEQSNNIQWQTGFKAFIHTCQILRAYMIHAGVGLGYFVEFFRFGTRKGQSSASYSRYAFNSDLAANVHREFKVAPGAVRPNSLAKSIEAIRTQDAQGRVQYCVHFTRSGNFADKYQQTARNKLRKERDKFIRLFSSFEIQHHQPKDLYGKRAPKANLTDLVRGLDVAGNENELPIEVFAPTIRVLRSSPWKNSYEHYQPPQRPHLSIHVGEDFNHLISGLRHIDETIQFCDMSYGDRLGHALALGIDVNDWAQKQGTCFVPAGVHLDNLVWLHHMVGKVAMQVPKVLPVLISLEHKISVWCTYVYGKAYGVSDLYQAWLYRRNCTVMQTKLKHSSMPYVKAMIPDFENSNFNTKAKAIWLEYVMSHQMSQGVGKKQNRQMESVIVYHTESHHPDAVLCTDKMQDFFCQAQLDAITAVQDYLMSVYDNKGIVIEACPSSNVFTGRFDDYHQHPLFRWCPPDKSTLAHGQSNNLFGVRSGPMKVCINTDDAGLFPTTIVNEHRVIKQAAIDHYGACVDTAQLWIDRLRDNGVEAFKRG